MRAFRTPSVRALALLFIFLITGSSLLYALQIRPQTSRFDPIAIPDPSIMVSTSAVRVEDASTPKALQTGWAAFKSVHGPAWDVTIDARSGAPLLVQGQGIPLIPGAGNSIQSAAAVTLDSLAGMLRSFVTTNASLATIDDSELVLNREGSGDLTPNLWKVSFTRTVAGVPVAGDSWIFYVGNGNLIAFGAPRWSTITTSALPYISADDAREVLFKYMGLAKTEKPELHDAGSLLFVPIAAAGSEVDSFSGSVGTGYETALAWRLELEVQDEPGRWEALVDAHSGKVLALNDTVRYAFAKGGVLPLTDDGICPDGCEQPNFPMPYANISIGASTSTASSMGNFSCAPGGSSATTTLNAQYIRVADVCGAISQSITCDADLDLKTSSGTDCTVPAGASAGDTHAARSSFYHLNRIKEHARAWLPANTWLQAKLTDNVNINQTCNANWSSGGVNGTVNFYRSGSGCRNTGEIASVFLHEWGHGLDQNDGGPGTAYDNPSEAYADISSLLLTHKSCIGRGFTSSNCGGYGNACLSCTGVRDQDWSKHTRNSPQTPENWPASCPSGSGPCSREEHCEAQLSGEAVWDLAVRDLTAAGMDQQTAWQTVDRLWFKSRTGSGGNAYSCGSPVENRSCAANAWMTLFRTIDDDDGNLANGTPHAAAIFAAFARHNITCGLVGDAKNQSTTTCPTLTAPALTATGSPNQIALSWTAVPGASSYNVLRNDQGCDWGHTLIANVAGTSYTDTNLPNVFPMYYAIQAVGADTDCLGALSTCASAIAGGPHAVYSSNARVADTCVSGGAGNNDSIYDPGEQIQFSVTLRNDGATGLTGVTATLTPTTPGVTMVDDTATYGGMLAGASSTSQAPHFTAQLPTGLACGSTVAYNVTINSDQGSWAGSFTQAIGLVTLGGGTVLSENFSGGIPGTWTVVNGGTGTGAAATWTTANPGSRTFTSPLASPVAIVDSDNAANTDQQDEQLITPVLNLSTATTVAIDFDEFFRWWSGSQSEKGDVDVMSSLTGGAWVNVLRNQNVSNPPVSSSTTTAAAHRTVDITAQAAGAANVQIRFHYYSAIDEWWWEVDNVVVTFTTPASCSIHTCNNATSADLSVAKSGPPTAAAGGNLSYSVSVTNNGPDAALNAQLSDAVPANTTFQSINAPAGWSCSTPPVGGTGTITCSTASLAASAPAAFTIVVKANTCAGNGTVVTNTAFVTTTTSDSNTGNNSSSANTTLSDTGACDDGDACTQLDACQAGVCVGSNPVTCTPSDQCHDAGTCNPATGVCSIPAKQNGSACNDGDACSQTDTCQAGTCTGGNPVVCTASDQCHDAGTCDSLTGQCSNPTKQDGSPCNDGDGCSQTDTCQAGACTGANPVVCTASDQCHDAGTCDSLTGQCSNPAKQDGVDCNDGDACSQTDTCQAGACTGANPVMCTASDQCHDVGTCDTLTGQCSNPAKQNGSACNDGDACSQTDTCQAGACTGGNPVVCTALDQCHDAGTCDTLTGQCSNPTKQDGVACNDADACSQTDTCQAGACTGSNPVVCVASDACHLAGTCEPSSGTCSDPTAPDSTSCDDGNECTTGDACTSGVCGGAPVAAPGEVGHFEFSDKTVRQWTALTVVGPAALYDVVRGALGEWPVGSGASEACQASGISDTTVDIADDPGDAGGFWYLVRGRNACGVGIYGYASGGSPRVTTACP